MGDIVKGLTEVQEDNTHCSSLIHQSGHFIIEVYQVGQAWFPHGESMLANPDGSLLLHMPRNGFLDYLSHYFPRDQGEADQSIGPLLEDRSDMCFLPVFDQFFQMLWSRKDYRHWPCNHICQLPEHSQSIPWGSMDLWIPSLLKYSLTWSSSHQGFFLAPSFHSSLWDLGILKSSLAGKDCISTLAF